MTIAPRRWTTKLTEIDRLAVFPLTGALLLPGGQLPLNIFEPRYLRMVDDVLAGSRLIGMIQPRAPSSNGPPPLYGVGCAGRITTFNETDDGRYLINLSGLSRFRVVEELGVDSPYRQVVADFAAFETDGAPDPSSALVDRPRLEAATRVYLEAGGMQADWEAIAEAPTESLVASLSMSCPFAPNEKQALLEAPDARARADCLIALMEMTSGGEDETPLQ